MRRTTRLTHYMRTGFGIVGIALLVVMPVVHADLAATPSLVISQLKITSSNGQFVTFYNATNSPLDLSKYQLQYFNNYDLSKATSSRLLTLQGVLPPHSYYQLNDSSVLLCYRLLIDSQSLGFSSTSGYLGLVSVSQNGAGGMLSPVLQDYVSWSKSAAAGAQTLPTNTNAFLQRKPTDPQGNPSVTGAGSGTWLPVQPDVNNACNIVSFTASPQPVATGLTDLLPSSEPEASFITAPAEADGISAPTAVLPAADIGLKAPTITELLPNPEGTGNDSTEEFIEFYNPNNATFDLTGFTIQTGLTASKSYTFKAGQTLPPHSFTAFYSDITSLSLSNTAGQARLLDPFSNVITITAQYPTAKDGQSWALAKGKWYFTTQPTPNKENIIKLPPATKKKATSKTAKPKIVTKKLAVKHDAKNSSTTGFTEEEPKTTPIHTWILALVVGGAVLYGAYEYRADIAHRIRKLKTNAQTSE